MGARFSNTQFSQNSQENTRVSFLINCRSKPVTLLKKKLWHWCFPVNFAKFLRIPFLTEHINDFIFPFLIKRKAYKFSKEYY